LAFVEVEVEVAFVVLLVVAFFVVVLLPLAVDEGVRATGSPNIEDPAKFPVCSGSKKIVFVTTAGFLFWWRRWARWALARSF
jgi:hypothetical protein